MNDTDKKPQQQAKSRAIAKPHADPWLIGFLVVAFIYGLVRIASAQDAAACPPAPTGTIFGIPITDLINVGVPACLTVYLVVKGIPDIVAKFETMGAAQRAHDQKTADELRAQINKLEDRIDRALEERVRDRQSGGHIP